MPTLSLNHWLMNKKLYWHCLHLWWTHTYKCCFSTCNSRITESCFKKKNTFNIFLNKSQNTMASAEGATRARAKDKGMNFTQLCRLDFYCMFLFRTLVTATFSKNLQNYSLFIRNDCPILLKQRVKFMHLIENSVVFGLRCSSTNGMLEKKN